MRTWLEQAGLLLLGLGLALAVAEGVLRYIVRYPLSYPAVGLFAPDPHLGYRMQPYYSGWYLKSGRRFFVETNAQGFRDRRDFAPPAPGTTRILALGDSFVFGMPVAADQTFVAFLERRLNADNQSRHWEVLNLGVPSYSSRQEAVLLRRFANTLHANAVLLAFYLGNDMYDNQFPPEAPAYRIHNGIQVTPEAALAAQRRWGELYFRFQMFSARLAIFQFFKSHVLSLLSRFGWTSEPTDSFGARPSPGDADSRGEWQHTQQALSDIIDYCNAQQLRLFILLIPYKPQFLIHHARRLAMGTPASPGLQHAFDMEPLRRRLTEYLQLKGATVFDPTQALSDVPDPAALFEPHGNHFLEPGSRLLGDFLAERILAAMRGLPTVTAREAAPDGHQ